MSDDLGVLGGEHADERRAVGAALVRAASGAPRRAGLARDAEAFHPSLRRRPALFHHHALEGGEELARGALGERTTDRVDGRAPRHVAAHVAPLGDDVGPHEEPAIRERGVGREHLQRRHLDGVADRHGGERLAAPVLGAPERAGDLAGQVDERGLAEAECAGVPVERRPAHLLRRLRHRDVGGDLDRLGEGDRAVARGCRGWCGRGGRSSPRPSRSCRPSRWSGSRARRRRSRA